jgi:hypothetical protein
VCTFLYELRAADIEGPLAVFQATEASQKDTYQLVSMLNSLLGPSAQPVDMLRAAFEQHWGRLERSLNAIGQVGTLKRPTRSERELLEELRRISGQTHWPPGIEKPLREMPCASDLLNVQPSEAAALLGPPQTGAEDLGLPAYHKNGLNEPQDSVDGIWSTRWTVDPNEKCWRTGTAKLVRASDFVVGIEVPETGGEGPHFIIASQREHGLLVGRWLSLSAAEDTGIWIGRIRSPERIQGRWKSGQWLFERRLDL